MIRALAMGSLLLLTGCALIAALPAAIATCAVSAPCDAAVATGIGAAFVLDDEGLKIWDEHNPPAK